jgi:hypothetical protein
LKVYKLTTQDGYTRKGEDNETKWARGYKLSLPVKDNPELCTADVIHAYKNINLGLLLNPQHADIANPQIWECKGDICVEDWGKCGCFELTTINKIKNPTWYKDNSQMVQVAFAILCAESVLQHYEDKFPNDDRPRKAIEAAKQYLKTKLAAYAAAADAAADAAAYAAAAYAADAAAYAAAYAADAADIDFCDLADKAVAMISGIHVCWPCAIKNEISFIG